MTANENQPVPVDTASGNFALAELETINRALDGIYYGPKVEVLVRTGSMLLLWVPGHAAWSGTGQPWRYAPSSMYVHRIGRHDYYKRLCEGGRKVARLKDCAAEIDKHFGEGFSALLEPKKTVVTG